MKIKTIEDLQEVIDSELSWRRLELIKIFHILKSRPKDKVLVIMLSRAGATLLYAHWEGFVKNVSAYYLIYIRSKRVNFQEILPCLISHNLKAQIIAASKADKFLPYINLISDIIDNTLSNKRATISCEINTGHNLTSSIFKDLFFSIGLGEHWEIFETKENLIDHELVNIRNKIAHGEKHIFDTEQSIQDLIQLHEDIVSLLETYKNCIINAALQKKYKRTSVGTL